MADTKQITNTNEGWQRDLLRECVEPNPGPYPSWLDMCKWILCEKVSKLHQETWDGILSALEEKVNDANKHMKGTYGPSEALKYIDEHKDEMNKDLGSRVVEHLACYISDFYALANQNKKRKFATNLEVPRVVGLDLEAVKKLHNALQKADLSHLNDPKKVSILPFPSLSQAPERFCWKAGMFKFVGRSAISGMEKAVLSFLNPPPPRLFSFKNNIHNMLVYGDVGMGKSHMMMALSLKIRKQCMDKQPVTRRIVIVPDAAALIGDIGFSNMLQAMLIAHADDEQALACLSRIQDWQELVDFCRTTSGDLVFLVDQAEKMDIGVTSINAQAVNARALCFQLVGQKHYAIFGASANAEMANFRYNYKQNRFDFYDVFGITETEMAEWLSHISITLSADELTILHKYSGVPLFLSWFIAIIENQKGTPDFVTAFEEYKQLADPYIIQNCRHR